MKRNPSAIPRQALEDTVSYRAILVLTWPQILMMVAHFLIGFVDVLVAGRIGPEVQATLGMLTQCLFFFLIVANAVANGSVAAISQSMGMGLVRRVQRYVGLTLMLSMGFGAVLLAAGLAGRGAFLSLLQVPESLLPLADYFLGVFLPMLPGYYLFIATNAVLRAQQRVDLPLYAMCLVTLLNTAGDLGFGLGWFGMPNYGYKGLVWSTFVSVHLGVLFNLAMFARMGMLCRTCLPPWRWIKRSWAYLFRVAWPSGAMQVLWHTAYLALFAIAAGLPANRIATLAGMTAGMRVEALLYLPGYAFNLTASILVGNYLGAGQPHKAKQAGMRILGMGCVAISLLALLVWIWIDPVTRFLAPDAEARAHAVSYLMYNLACIPFTEASMILGGIMGGAGATLYNLFIIGLSAWAVRLPLAYFLGHVWWGEASGIWAAMFVSQVVQSTALFCVFQFGNWRRFGMRAPMPRRSGRPDQGALSDEPTAV